MTRIIHAQATRRRSRDYVSAEYSAVSSSVELLRDNVEPEDSALIRADEAQRHAISRLPHGGRARIDDWHAVSMRSIEAIVIRVAAVGLPTIGDLVDAQLA